MKSKTKEAWFIIGSGNLAVTMLRLLPLIPFQFLEKLLQPFLIVYPFFRKNHVRRMKACWKALPFEHTLTVRTYYRNRLRIFLRTLKQHGKDPEGENIIRRFLIRGEIHYREALEKNRPIILLGLHLGLFENLHRLPMKPVDRPFGILTAKGFAESLTKYMVKGRELGGKRMVLRKNFSEEVRRVIQQRGILAMMVDQNPEVKSEENSLLLWNKISICYPRRLLEFAVRNGFLILPVATIVAKEIGRGEVGTDWIESKIPERAKEGIEFGEPWIFSEGKISKEIIEEKVRMFLEKHIESLPELWNWSYGKVST